MRRSTCRKYYCTWPYNYIVKLPKRFRTSAARWSLKGATRSTTTVNDFATTLQGDGLTNLGLALQPDLLQTVTESLKLPDITDSSRSMYSAVRSSRRSSFFRFGAHDVQEEPYHTDRYPTRHIEPFRSLLADMM